MRGGAASVRAVLQGQRWVDGHCEEASQRDGVWDGEQPLPKLRWTHRLEAQRQDRPSQNTPYLCFQEPLGHLGQQEHVPAAQTPWQGEGVRLSSLPCPKAHGAMVGGYEIPKCGKGVRRVGGSKVTPSSVSPRPPVSQWWERHGGITGHSLHLTVHPSFTL